MKHWLYLNILLFISILPVQAQSEGKSGRFTLKNLTGSGKIRPDTLSINDSIRTDKEHVKAFRLTSGLGEVYRIPMDTLHLNTAQSTMPDYHSVAVGYVGNNGSPIQSKIFTERKEARDFFFADAYDYYITDPRNAMFYDTKLPYTSVLYSTEGGGVSKNEQLKGVLTSNFGKKINVGAEMDYIYSRGQYKNNGNKMLSYRLFGNFKSDHYEAYAYLSNYNFVNFENGGMANDSVITHPDDFLPNQRQNDPRTYPIRYPSDSWNRIRGKQYFLSHRYNLGFDKEIEGKLDSLGNPVTVFVPVSSFIHTVEYEDNRRHYVGANTNIDKCYLNEFGYPRIFGLGSTPEDRSSTWNLKNTIALSLREGFQDWVKFGLSAFVRLEQRKFRQSAPIPGVEYDPLIGSGLFPEPSTINFSPEQTIGEFSTYLGAELSKKRGTLLTYNARGELCLVGDDVGEFRVKGNLQTRFKLLKKDATVTAEGFIRNTTPSYSLRHFHSRYFWWDNDFNMIQHIYAGAKVNLESTGTQLSAGVESLQNYIYINEKGMPQQKSGNLQVVTARLKQDFNYKALGWENEIVYQLSSDKKVLPLPDVSLYSNLYLHFKFAKVLTIQIGTDVHYHTSYHAPYYEPATQQFQVQNDVKVGNYPLINAYVNFHLKQARFFVMGYNLSEKFVKPNYFSLAHYPMNPMVLKMGISVTFNN